MKSLQRVGGNLKYKQTNKQIRAEGLLVLLFGTSDYGGCRHHLFESCGNPVLF